METDATIERETAVQDIVKSPSPIDDVVAKALDAAGRTAEEVAADAFIISPAHDSTATDVPSDQIPPSDAQKVEMTKDADMPSEHVEKKEETKEEVLQSPEKEIDVQPEAPHSSDTEVPKTDEEKTEEKASALGINEEEVIEEIPRHTSSFSTFSTQPVEEFHQEWAMASSGRPSSSNSFTFKSTGDPFEDVRLLIAIAEAQSRVIQQQQNKIQRMKEYLQSTSKSLISWERDVKRKLKKRKAEAMVIYNELGLSQDHLKQKTLLLRSSIDNLV